MNRHEKAVVTVVVGIAWFVSIRAMCEEPPEVGSPNVLVVVLDSLRADRVSMRRNGVALMPNLSAFAQDSMNFTDAVAPCTWTKPSVASLFTSLYADAHGVWYNEQLEDVESKTDVLPASIETMAAYLKKAGYSTAAVQTNGGVAREAGFAQGFDVFEFSDGAGADWTTATGIKLADTLAQPFFLYLHYMDSHFPYAPPQEYRDLLGFPEDLSETDRLWTEKFQECFFDHGAHLFGLTDTRLYEDPSPRGQEAIRILYDGDTKHLDDHLGRLFTYFGRERSGAIIAVLADHGEAFLEHGLWTHGTTMYEEMLKVPFVLRFPGMAGPCKVPDTVETIDLLPTLADLLHLEPNPVWQGESLFAADRPKRRPAFSCTRIGWRSLDCHIEQVQFAGPKLIINSRAGEAELYDLGDDPREKSNLVEKYPGKSEPLRTLLRDHSEENKTLRERLGPPETKPLGPQLKEHLRSLGYVD